MGEIAIGSLNVPRIWKPQKQQGRITISIQIFLLLTFFEINSSRGRSLSPSGYSFNVTSIASSNDWIIDYREFYYMAKDKTIFSTLNECNTKQIFVGYDKSTNVVGQRTIQLDDRHFNDVLFVPSFS